MTKPKRMRRREGDILEVPLPDGRLAYARVLPEPLVGFYEALFVQRPAFDGPLQQRFAFKIWVMNYALTDGDWPRVAHFPLSDAEREKPWFVHQDAISKRVSLYQQGGGEASATYEQAAQLEADAVWEPEQVIERLEDHFAGRSNKHVEGMRQRALADLRQ